MKLKSLIWGACVLSVLASGTLAHAKPHKHPIKRVLLISVDGMHAVDLETLVSNSSSTMASLASNGVRFTNAFTPRPSDSFPGLMALITGGSPASTGIWYDVSFNHVLFPPGSSCAGSPGTVVAYDETLDIDLTKLSGGGTPGFDGSSVNVANLPLQKSGSSCTPVFPHSYLLVNTIFEVVKNKKKTLTAWSDKHPGAYEIVNGPSGTGVDEFWSPEINSQPPAALDPPNPTTGGAYTDTLAAVEFFDGLKVKAILNEIDGLDPTGKTKRGVPTLFGMNFQTVSVGQKLPSDATGLGLPGYADSVGTPNPGLLQALNFVDKSIGSMVDELQNKGLLERTLVVITAKHGQSPIDINRLLRIPADNGGMSPATILGSEIAASGDGAIEDDASLMWLADPSKAAADAAILSGFPNASSVAGIGQVFSGQQLQLLWGNSNPAAAGRIPDLFVQPNYGTVYTGKKKKIAEHGGSTNDDRNVALIVYNPGFSSAILSGEVTTMQVAPTILSALKLDPSELQAVQIEGAQALPGLPF